MERTAGSHCSEMMRHEMQWKALFLPSYLGGGFGHIGRCLALAGELEARGWQTAFASGGQHVERLRGAGIRVFELRHPAQQARRTGQVPAYTCFSNMNYQLVRDGLVRPAIIRACVAEQLGVIRAFQPDLLIADTWPLASILAHLVGLPLVQVMRSVVHPSAPNLLWWKAPPEELVSPDPQPVFNPVLKSWGMAPIRRAEDLLVGDLVLVPSIPELDPLPDGLETTCYTGPLVRNEEEAAPPWLEAMGEAGPLVYVTTGGGAGLAGGEQFYRVVMDAVRGTGWQVILSTGARINPESLPSPPPNVRLEAWVPGPAVIARSRLVVYSGGYGTSMEIVGAGVPGLIIPWHSEQESNARRLEACGAARVLLPCQAAPAPIWHRWPGGAFSTLVCPTSDLTPEALRQAIHSALDDADLQANAIRLRDLAAGYRGASRAAELIEELMAARTAPGSNGWDSLSWWQKLILKGSKIRLISDGGN